MIGSAISSRSFRAQGDAARILRQIGLDDRELIATQASHDIGASDGDPKAAGDRLQELIAADMPKAIVDDFEAVEVKEHHPSIVPLRFARVIDSVNDL